MSTSDNKYILIPVDFSIQSEYALAQSHVLADFEGTRILLLHVLEHADFFSELFRKTSEIDLLEADANNIMSGWADEYSKKYNIPVHTRVVKGKVHEKILEVAQEINASYIIMGKGYSETTKWAGSNTEKVVERSHCPVITVSEYRENIGLKTIVLPLDLMQQFNEKVDQAVYFSKHYGSEIKIVSVLIGNVKATQSRIWRKMTKVHKMLLELGVNCTTELIPKSNLAPYQEIIQYAEKVNADLILIRTHQEKVSSDNYIGRFARNIINESKLPVLSLTAAANRKAAAVIRTLFDPFGLLEVQKTKKAKKKRKIMPKSTPLQRNY